MGLRVLVLSADIGESHAAMARTLIDDLRSRADVAHVASLNDFSSLGPVLSQLLPRGFRFHLGKVKWTYDLTYRVFKRAAPARGGEWALYRLGAEAMLRTVAEHRPDVVVSTYPVMNPVLAHLRASARLSCPVAAVVGPLGGLRFWVQPAADLHLALYPEAVPEIRRLAGRDSARAVRPLVRREFFAPLGVAAARDALGLPQAAKLVLVSGGGWGAGDLRGAIDAALAVQGTAVLAVTGRNHLAETELAHRYRDQTRVRVLGFTRRMRDLMCAADAFVTATAGLSCLEARLCGCPTVCYGFAVGHVRDNTRAMAEHGLASRAASAHELEGVLRRVLAGSRLPLPRVRNLPTAAQLVVELAGTPPARPRPATDGRPVGAHHAHGRG